MSKVSQKTSKYVIKADLHSAGVVEKPDVVGAIFGQTEGLLDEDLDLRELQERGRIGRIQVNVDNTGDSSKASIKIPSSLDAANTAILAASLETIERVGPTTAEIEVEEIKDQRVSKRDYIVKRAKQLLSDIQSERPERSKITSEVKQEVRSNQVTEYKGFQAGPEVEEADEIILVEGRADLLQLLKHGVKNTVAMGGTDVPEKIKEVTEDKDVVAFVDGDRGGDLILKELKEHLDVEKVARAPEDMEVEDLDKKKIYTALRDIEDGDDVNVDAERQELDPEKKEVLSDLLGDLVGTRAVYLLDSDLEVKQKLPLNSLEENNVESCHAVVLDGEIGIDTLDVFEGQADLVVGMGKSGHATSSDLRIFERSEL